MPPLETDISTFATTQTLLVVRLTLERELSLCFWSEALQI